ncbi:MAG: hypothetical protein IKR88_01930 [Bacteroidales bacterium]|nr:hypothetical protein [Bacteroidales bacterium]
MNHNLIKTKAISVAMTLLGSIIFVPNMVSKPSGSTSMESNANQSTTMSPVMRSYSSLDWEDYDPKRPYYSGPFSSYNDVKAKIQTESPIDESKVNERKVMSGSFSQIPYTEGMTSSGARTYTVPIKVFNTEYFGPELALVYNSQSQDGIAGYGWDVSGLSNISLTTQSLFYDGKKNYSREPVLDGMRLFPYTGPLSPEYSLCTEEGNCLVKIKKRAQNSTILQYEVLFPDGRIGVYGIDDEKAPHYFYPLIYMKTFSGAEIYYDYIIDGNIYYISKIRFGYYDDYTASWQSEGGHFSTIPKEIVFVYENFNTMSRPSRYKYGVELNQRKLLKSIKTDINTTYELSHNGRFLTTIGYKNAAGVSFRPLQFTYGENVNNNTSGNYEYTHTSQYKLPDNYNNKALYATGHLVPGEPSESIVFYPENTKNTNVDWKKYNMVVIPRLNSFKSASESTVIELPLEYSCETIKLMDVDGDGTDEIIKIVKGNLSNSNTSITVFIYKVNESGDNISLYRRSTFVVADNQLNAGLHYMFGNFDDNYHAHLVTISYKSGKKKSQTTVIDLTSDTRLSHYNTKYQLEASGNNNDACNYLVFDSDADGKTNLFYVEENGLREYYLNYNKEFKAYSSVRSIPGLSSPRKSVKHFNYADMNGDGYMDIVVAPKEYKEYQGYGIDPSWSGPITIHYNKGDSFVSAVTVEKEHIGADSFVILDDIDKDGACDIIARRDDGTYFYLSKNGFKAERSTVAIGRGNACVPIKSNVYERNDRFVSIKYSSRAMEFWGFTEDCSKEWKVVKFEDSYGLTRYNTYKSTCDNTAYSIDYNRQYNPSTGFYRGCSPMDVLYRSETILPTGGRSECRFYTYYDASYSNQGLGFVCFGKIRIIDALSDRIITKEYLPEKLGGIGKEETFAFYENNSIRKLSTVTNLYNTFENHNNYIKYSINLKPQLIKSISENLASGIIVTREYEYGRFDLVTKQTTKKSIGSGLPQTETKLFRYVNRFTSSVFDIDVNHMTDTKYIVGALADVTTIKEADGIQNSSIVEREEYIYGRDFHSYTKEKYRGIIYPTGTHTVRSYTGPVDYSLQWVNVESSNVKPTNDDLNVCHSSFTSGRIEEAYVGSESLGYNFDLICIGSNSISKPNSTLTNKYGWMTKFCLSQKIDSLGRKTEYKDFNGDKEPNKIVSYKGTTTYVRDAVGNIIQENSYDGDVVNYTYSWIGDTGSALYSIKENHKYKPSKITYYDALGRVVRTAVQKAPNGSAWKYTDMVYDINGNLIKESLPYSSGKAKKWYTYEYDEYDRILKHSDGAGRVTSWMYNGTSMTRTTDNVSVTVNTDANGNTISVQRGSKGKVIYTLNDDGQPIQIKTSDNAKILMEYSLRGERTKTTDPSSGVVNETIEYLSDGTIKVTSVNPNGTVITYKDKYDRVTRVDRPGEYNTTYTYDSNGFMTLEQSTNGTGKEYVYNQNRPGLLMSVKEYVPDGKWLKKTFTYGSGEQLASVKYTSNNGDITTLRYSYSKGILNKIALPDGTPVNQIVEENDLGLPTKVITGGIQRDYGYTDYGLPTFRKMDGGNLQNAKYVFDQHTGNLNSRTDYIHNKTEQFGYYEDGSLKNIGSRYIEYSENGDIVSIDGVGSMYYDSPSHPYQITSFEPESSALVADRQQNITFTCYGRPSRIDEGGRSASFTYNGDGDRVKMYVADGLQMVLTRYYIGEYEFDQTTSGTKEKLYLGGDAYSAPMVYVKENSGIWNLYNIGRDYLGNINIIAKSDGQLVAEYSYDPWGRLRNPETLKIYLPGEEPELFLGRGFAGHEHLTWFGLINMNARLYDPLVGRFLSADPYAYQDYATPGYNRYSYALNNPLRYVDPDGEFFLDIHIGADGFRLGIDIYIFKLAVSGDWHGNFNAYFMIGKEFGQGNVTGSFGIKVGVTYSCKTRSTSVYASAEATLKVGAFGFTAAVKYDSVEKLTTSLGMNFSKGGFSGNGSLSYSSKTGQITGEIKASFDRTFTSNSAGTDNNKSTATSTSNTSSSDKKLPSFKSLEKTKVSSNYTAKLTIDTKPAKPADPVAVNPLCNMAYTTFYNDRVSYSNNLSRRRFSDIVF